MIRIIVIDEQQATLKRTCNVLSIHKDFEIVGTAKDIYDASRLLVFANYDIVIFDWFSSTNEIENGYIIHAFSSKIPKAVIMLTDHEDEAHIYKALENNIKGYLIKSSDLHILPDSIRCIMQNDGFYINHKIAVKSTIMYSKLLQKNYITKNADITFPSVGSMPHLSKNEINTLLFVFKGYNYKEIAKELLLCEATVRNYYYTGTKKAGLRNRRDLANFIKLYDLDKNHTMIDDKYIIKTNRQAFY